MDTNNKSVNSTTFDARKAGTNFVLPLTSGTTFAQEGLTKREYFAGLAMQGLLVNNSSAPYKLVSEWSIAQADELLKQLNEK